MDVLSDMLQSVRLTGAVFFDVSANHPMVAETPAMRVVCDKVMPDAEHVIPFHIMLHGRCWAEPIDGSEEPVELNEGDIIIYPRGHAHVFGSDPGQRLAPDLSLYENARQQPLPLTLSLCDSPSPTLHFVCGYLGCDAAPFNPLLDALPAQFVARRPAEGNHIEVDLIENAVRETRMNRPGGSIILTRLSELLFVSVLRRHIELLPEASTGWFAGLSDSNIAKALQLLHERPSHDWTLEELARETGMSRSALAERFSHKVGQTPMKYLTRWRMQLAAQRLRETSEPVSAIAEDAGFQSESAFIRSFKSIVGESPGAWRRKMNGPAALMA
jgi:AraC-like DNA-binding protein